MGQENCNLPKVVLIIADVVDSDLVDQSSNGKLVGVWKRLQQMPPKPALNVCKCRIRTLPCWHECDLWKNHQVPAVNINHLHYRVVLNRLLS